MISYKALSIPLLLLLVTFSALGQTKHSQYIVLTFEDTYKNSQHGTDTYYWIISADSLKKRNIISPLLLSGFSKNTLESCCKGEPFDPFVVTAVTSYDFAESFFVSTDSLRKLIFKNRIKIQAITKNWVSGQKEKIQVFASPISGNFCSSSSTDKYNGRIYFPVSNFQYIDNFWKTVPIKLIERDFTKVEFAIFQNLSRRR